LRELLGLTVLQEQQEQTALVVQPEQWEYLVQPELLG
jgi:hypothetical protein